MTRTNDSYEASSPDLPRCFSASSFLVPEHIVLSGWLEHGPFAFWLVNALKPRTYVELGSHRGFSYFAFCQAVKKYDLGTSCYAVDTWRGDEHAGFYGDTVYQEVVDRNAAYSSFSTLLRTTFDKGAEGFAEKSVDLLHVDGRHFYDDVKADFEAWRPKMADSGVVLFHDTNVRERDFGVWRYFAELKNDHPTFEFLHGHGLGVVALGAVPPALTDLFNASEQQTNEIRSAYAQLGSNIGTRCRLDEVDKRMAMLSSALLQRAERAESALRFIETGKSFAKANGKTFSRLFARAKFWSRGRKKAVAERIRQTNLFDDNFYRATNPDVVLRGVDPLWHFVQEGCDEGRKPNAFFDPAYYRQQNPEIVRAGINPVVHFAEEGWKNNCKPSPDFDPASYLRQYPGLFEAQLNPLVHYLYEGTVQDEKSPKDASAQQDGRA